MSLEFIVKRAANNQFYFILQLQNGNMVLASGRYIYRVTCLDAIQVARDCSKKEHHFQTGMATSGGHFFVLRGADHEIICTSEIFDSIALRDEAMEIVKKSTTDAPVRDHSLN